VENDAEAVNDEEWEDDGNDSGEDIEGENY
jgi:hypothetical protein